MSDGALKVLVVDDPAVSVYVGEKYGVLERYGKEVQFDVVPWSVYYDTMMDVFAGKADYDVIMVAGHLWVCDFARKGYLAELSYDFEDILPVVVSEMQLDGKTYLSPSFCDGHIIVYRKSVVRDVLDKSWGDVITPGELAEAAGKIAEATGKPSIALKADVSEIFTDALPYLRMNGGDVYKGEKAFSSRQEVAAGLETYCSLKQYAPKGVELFGNDEVAAAIRSGETPLAVTWSGQMGVVYTDDCIEKEDLGFATFSTAWNTTWSFAVSAGSGKKQEAEAFLAYLRSKEVDALAGAVSGAPVRRSSYEAGRGKYSWYDCQLTMLRQAVPLPSMPRAGEKHDIFYRQIAEAFAGKKTAAQAMADAQEAINQIG